MAGFSGMTGVPERELKDSIAQSTARVQETFTGTTSQQTGSLALPTAKPIVKAWVTAPSNLDVFAIPVNSRTGAGYVKVLNWDMTPVTNTTVTITYETLQ